jgi:glutamine amidotransferase
MCRLYGLQATHSTRPACELLDAQNALIRQSREDARGLSNPHGWGVGHVANGQTACFRQVQPATESADYRRAALDAEGTLVLAHVRRATVGTPDHANTHPFRQGPALLIHNGHVPAFDRVRPRLLDRLDAPRRQAIQGRTDSEHVFALLLQLRSERPEAPLHAVTRQAVHDVQEWVQDVEAGTTVHAVDGDLSALPHDDLIQILGLNLLWTDGTALGGARLNRTLWTLERSRVPTCSLCGTRHADPPPDADYHATVLASERITGEDWTAVPNASAFSAAPHGALHVEPLGAP